MMQLVFPRAEDMKIFITYFLEWPIISSINFIGSGSINTFLGIGTINHYFCRSLI